MTGQICYRLFVHAAMQHGRYEIMPQGVKVEMLGEAVLVIDFTQALGEGVWMDMLTVGVDKKYSLNERWLRLASSCL